MKKCLLLLLILLAQPTILLADVDIDDELFIDLYSDYDAEGANVQNVPDPLYYMNLGFYHFNDTFYTYLLDPAARGYAKVIPKPARTGIRNFFYNLAFPIRFVNCILQLKFAEAAKETGIFTFNTAFGLGFFKGAQKEFGIENSNEDFGQTLGSYSIGEGFYLVLPFFGPSNLRDTVGIVGDTFLTPFTYIEPDWLGPAVAAQNIVNSTSLSLGEYEKIKDASIDPYTAIKDGYIKARRLKIMK